MPCDIMCKNHEKASRNGVVEGHRLMIGEVFCKTAKRKLTAIEASAASTPEWCPKGIDRKATSSPDNKNVRNSAEPSKDIRPSIETIPRKEKVAQAKSPAPEPKCKSDQMQNMVARLNRYRDEYYNKNAPSVSDTEYDRLFDELERLEQETGCVMSNSPTQTVGYKAVSALEKIIHPIPLLSLEKTKSAAELATFAGSQQFMLMHKLDGLTIELDYDNGLFQCASTRGDGVEGEIVSHNVPAISGIPMTIPYKKKLVVVGEAYIRRSDFELLKGILLDSSGKPYRNARNLAAGSVRCFNAAECVKRLLHFTPFGVLVGLEEYPDIANSKFDKLNRLVDYGFSRCGLFFVTEPLSVENAEAMIKELSGSAEREDIPIDGIVCTYNDVAFSRTCGRTGHHYKDGLAFKFEDDQFETVLQSIKWTPTRSGEISSVALFDPVEIDGCEVKRATLFNLTFIKDLELMPGCRILVSKRNMIIPHIEGNLDRGRFESSIIPTVCPCCGKPTKVQIGKDKDGRDIETLYCNNPECESQRLRQFVHFVGKKAMNIDGLSKATLEQFIDNGWLDTFMDVYRLDRYRSEIIDLEGFGEKSYNRLWDAIQASRNTTFERYLISMDIPMIGRTASGHICRQFNGSLDAFETAVGSGYDFTQLSGFGDTLHQNIHDWFKDDENRLLWKELQREMNIQSNNETASANPKTTTSAGNIFAGKTIVATGKLAHFSRFEINAKICSLGAVAGDTVTKKTDYLICGEKAGSKLNKARELGITVLTED